MNIEDRLAILELIAKYSYTYDAKDAEGYAALFTADAVWEAYLLGATEPASQIVGRAAIRTWAQQAFEGRIAGVQTRHHQTGTIVLESSPTSAKAKTMALLTHWGPEDQAPRPTGSGVYYDELVKTEDGWMFSKRALFGDRRERMT